jgi:hypothetical protein
MIIIIIIIIINTSAAEHETIKNEFMKREIGVLLYYSLISPFPFQCAFKRFKVFMKLLFTNKINMKRKEEN